MDENPIDDPAFARLQAADPARDAAPDLTGVHAAVSSATGVDVTEETILVDELATRRAGRAPRWLQVAAVAAGIAVIGGGSYALGNANGEAAPAAAPAMSLGGDVPAREGAGGAAGADSSASSAAPDSKLAGGYGYGFGHTVFTAKGLSAEGAKADAYGFDAVSTYTQEAVARAAAALGVAGDPRQEYGSWTVGPNDGSTASVSIGADGLSSISYYDPSRDPWACAKSATDSIEKPSSADVAPETTCDPGSGAAVSKDGAIATAKDTMTALGVDPAGYEYEATVEPQTVQPTTVSAYQVVDGQRTGVSWSFTVDSVGVQSLYGSLAPTVALGAYAVVSPQDAVARLGDPRFGSSSGAMPYAAAVDGAAVREDAGSGVSSDLAAPSAEPTVPATPTAGSPIAWPVQHVTIVSARLGLAVTYLPDGASVLAPTYELSDADGDVWTVIAVVDDQLDFGA